MNKFFQVVSIAVLFVLALYWAPLEKTEESFDRKRAFNGASQQETGDNTLPKSTDTPGNREVEDQGFLELDLISPLGRFAKSRVLDRKIELGDSANTEVTAYFLLEGVGNRNRMVFLEQQYQSDEDGNELSLKNQYAAVGDEIIFDANPLLVDARAFEDYLESENSFVSRKSRLSSFVQIKLRSPSVSAYLNLLSELGKQFPNTVVSRDDLYFTSAEPAEYSSALQWHLDQIRAPDAWEFTTGEDDVVVAVIDTGCNVGHPDLSDNIFVNTAEIPDNGIDDDSNGFVDDLRGWDFLDDDAIPNDETGHGTHVSGIVGARGDNGIGTSGIGWNIKVLPLKVGDSTGLSSSAIAEALRYVSSFKGNGVKIVATNNSYGSSAPNSVARTEIKVHEDIGIVFVAAAGNAGEDIDATGNSQYPAGFPESNIISVANSTQGDDLSFGSNFGVESVDIAAPGQEVYSTYRDNGYDFLTGTSMSSPIVAGAVALLAAHEPGLSATELRQRVFDSAEPLDSLSGKVATGGRIDLLAMLEPDLKGHTISVPSHKGYIVLLPDPDIAVEFEVEAQSDASTTLEYLGTRQDVRIQEISAQNYSVQFGSTGNYSFRFRSEKRGIVREIEKFVVVGTGVSSDVTTGLLHSWDLQEDGSLAIDSIGSGNAELVGATRVDTPLGRGIDFDGTSSFARFNATYSPHVTLSAFVKSDDLLSSPHPRIINMPDYYLYFSTRGISDVPDGNANTLKFYSNRTGDFGVWNSPPDTVFEGEWMHVLASYDSSEIANAPKLYINGVEQKVRLQRIPVGEQTTSGGAAYLGDREDETRAWDGQMDEVRVYNRTVDKEEVSRLAARYASAVWNAYSLLAQPNEDSEGTFALSLVDASNDVPAAEFEWSLVDEAVGISLSDAGGSTVEVTNPENVNTRIVLKASNSLGVRYYIYDLISNPPVIGPGVYTGTTSTGGTLWVEVEEGLRNGSVTILDENSSISRIREPILIDPFGNFVTDRFLPFRVTGKIDGGVSGQIEETVVTFSGENIEPSSGVSGFAGFFSGGVIGRGGQSFDLRVLDNGDAFLWRIGASTELIKGAVSVDGDLDFMGGDGSLIAGVIDSARENIRGTVSAGSEVKGIYLRRGDLNSNNRYVNLSTRGLSGFGENVLIGGFVLSGSESRTVLIRGIGPDLESRGVVDFLPNPLIQVFSGSQVIAENEIWGDQSNVVDIVAFADRAQASPLPLNSLDAALLLDLNPGLYTVFLDSNGEEGEGLFEIFDDPDGSEPSLFNVSTRGKVSANGNPLIAGFVISGIEPKPVLIRALGPALADRGIVEPLADPWIEVFSEGVAIASNDDWSLGSSPSSGGNSIKGPARGLVNAFQSSGATPLEFGSKDAAMLVWLEPGLYTAVARGVDGAEGIALVEVYEID